MRSLRFWLVMGVALGLAGCRSSDDKSNETGVVEDTQADSQTETGSDSNPDTAQDTEIDTGEPLDADGDGFIAALDCDDTRSDVNPSAEETCDGVDNDCDGVLDESDAVDAPTWYQDTDGDGFGTDTTESSCSAPHGYSAYAGDCDDSDPAWHPGASESDCSDPSDYNCDGSVGYTDADGDGFAACVDCDDDNGSVNESTPETCDGLDNDCDGSVDEDASDAATWYVDADGDGHGGSQFTTDSCSAPTGYVSSADDCNDLDGNSYPGASETCDFADNDCDGSVDEGVLSTWYADADGDGYGGSQFTTESCTAPAGYVSSSDDCDDLDGSSYPGAVETCDFADNDCDGSVDEGVLSTWYADADGDGYGDAATTTDACTLPSGHSNTSNDCDDTNANNHPGAWEICDGVDNDCDASTDEDDAINATTWYADSDGDGFGNAASSSTACAQPSGYVTSAGDCDDTSAAIAPGAIEQCDSTDNDCDGTTDEADAIDASTWYADTDGDGYGDAASTTVSCYIQSGYVASSDDCNDSTSAASPSGTEVCGDGLDNDCNGDVDGSDATDASTWYADTDSDTYGDAAATTSACTQPSGYVADATDCNDGDANVFPDANGDCYLENCLALLNAGRSTGDGLYTIDPTGSSSYEVYCDMTTDSGGWTLVANLSDSGSDVWSQFMPSQDAGLWDDSTTLGTTVSFTSDYKSQAYMDVPGTSLLIQEAQSNVLYANNCWSQQSFQTFISSLSWNSNGSDSNWSDSTGAHLCNFEHFGVDDTVLRAGNHSGSERVLGFKWGERDGVQDGNKDRTMITTYKANGYSTPHHVDLPTGLGGFTAYGSSQNYEDVNECQGDGPDQCSNSNQDYQLLVR